MSQINFNSNINVIKEYIRSNVVDATQIRGSLKFD